MRFEWKAKAAAALLAAALVAGGSGAALSARGRMGTMATLPQGIEYAAGSLKDGVYAGTANGYMPNLTVEVVVEGGKIASVRVLSHNETPRWYRLVARLIPDGIVSSQSTAIDVVSGATASSRGILSAVENALAKAAK